MQSKAKKPEAQSVETLEISTKSLFSTQILIEQSRVRDTLGIQTFITQSGKVTELFFTMKPVKTEKVNKADLKKADTAFYEINRLCSDEYSKNSEAEERKKEQKNRDLSRILKSCGIDELPKQDKSYESMRSKALQILQLEEMISREGIIEEWAHHYEGEKEGKTCVPKFLNKIRETVDKKIANLKEVLRNRGSKTNEELEEMSNKDLDEVGVSMMNALMKKKPGGGDFSTKSINCGLKMHKPTAIPPVIKAINQHIKDTEKDPKKLDSRKAMEYETREKNFETFLLDGNLLNLDQFRKAVNDLDTPKKVSGLFTADFEMLRLAAGVVNKAGGDAFSQFGIEEKSYEEWKLEQKEAKAEEKAMTISAYKSWRAKRIFETPVPDFAIMKGSYLGKLIRYSEENDKKLSLKNGILARIEDMRARIRMASGDLNGLEERKQASEEKTDPEEEDLFAKRKKAKEEDKKKKDKADGKVQKFTIRRPGFSDRLSVKAMTLLKTTLGKMKLGGFQNEDSGNKLVTKVMDIENNTLRNRVLRYLLEILVSYANEKLDMVLLAEFPKEEAKKKKKERRRRKKKKAKVDTSSESEDEDSEDSED